MQQDLLSLPVFSSMDITSLKSQLEALLQESREKVKQLCQQESPTWASFAEPLQAIDVQIENFWSPVSHINAVKNSDELRQVYQDCIALLTAYGSEMGQNKDLFEGYKKLSESAEFASFEPAQKAWVEHAMKDFHLSGIDLPESDQERFKQIKARLAELSQQFSNNVLDATAAWQKIIEDESELKGLPESALVMLKGQAEEKEEKGFLLTLDFPVYQAVATYASNRALREEMYMAYMTKASDQGPNAGEFDNSKIMVETLQLKQEMATLLGYAHYSEQSLATKMAESVEQVTDFLNDLAEKSLPFAEKEYQVLADYAKEKCHIQNLQPWDLAYVSELYRQEKFSLNDEVLREYFPLERVLDGMFDIVSRLYNVSFKQRETFDTYHEDVRFYEIYQGDKLLAGFFFDLFAREKKRGGAWMADCRSRWKKDESLIQLPMAFLTCNFRPASGEKPALLSHSEVTTLFHEFGHGLHHMLTKQDISGVSGISGVEWDAVELPSQFMENWCWQEESIALISSHYETGEALPADMLNGMLAAKNFNAGLMMLRQLEFALFDMLLHCMKHIDDANQVQLVLDQVRDKVSLMQVPDAVRFQHAFSHIFAGGYAAGYYSYKWAEVLSADAFSLFEEKGIFDKESGALFFDNVLAMGSARPASESFKAFRGREPSTDALLKHSGLAA